MHHRFAWAIRNEACSCTRGAKRLAVRETIRRIVSLGDCVALVRHAVQARGSTEGACELLTRALIVQPPSERETRRLSLLQQSASGRHDECDYAATTLWLCVISAIIEQGAPRRRVHTWPRTHRSVRTNRSA